MILICYSENIVRRTYQQIHSHHVCLLVYYHQTAYNNIRFAVSATKNEAVLSPLK